jgi:hypothetical protein
MVESFLIAFFSSVVTSTLVLLIIHQARRR